MIDRSSEHGCSEERVRDLARFGLASDEDVGWKGEAAIAAQGSPRSASWQRGGVGWWRSSPPFASTARGDLLDEHPSPLPSRNPTPPV